MPPVLRVDVKISAARGKEHHKLWLPKLGSKNAGAYDIYAPYDIQLAPNETCVPVELGFRLSFPNDFKMQIQDRSSMYVKRKISVFNGLIDADYRGEIMLYLNNMEAQPKQICAGERIAQMSLSPTYQQKFIQVADLEGTKRGTGGIGSTGY